MSAYQHLYGSLKNYGVAIKLVKLPFLSWFITTGGLLLICRYCVDSGVVVDALQSWSQFYGWPSGNILVTAAILVAGWLCLAIYRCVMLRCEVSWRKQAEEKALHLARFDPLTGLLNRRAFFEEAKRLVQTKEDGGEHAIFFVDVDKFKAANDIHGHAAGDTILLEVAHRLAGIANKALVARVGGDEFVLLVSSVSGVKQLLQLGHQLSRVIERPIKYERASLIVRASIGISSGHGDIETLLRTADIAMYQAKKQGGRRFQFFEEWMDAELQQQAALREELRNAIMANQVVAFLQPFVDLSTGEIAGFEALARWKHPVRGLLTPDKFITLAEEDGLIGELFFSILRQTCKEALKWAKPLSIAVNVSPIQLTDSSLAESVLRLLARMKFDPNRLELEITESSSVQDREVANRTLAKLRTAGVHISLDDFGTGFSSLYQLKEMPFDKIKLDKSFVGNSVTDPKNHQYVSAMVSFGRELGLQITAEGIEDLETAEWLASLGCPYGQGYLFSRPLSADAASEMLREKDNVAAESRLALLMKVA